MIRLPPNRKYRRIMATGCILQRLRRLVRPSDKWVSSEVRYGSSEMGSVDKLDNTKGTNMAYISSTDTIIKQNEANF